MKLVSILTFKWTDIHEKRKKLREATGNDTTELVKNVPELLNIFKIELLGSLSSSKYSDEKYGSYTCAKVWIMLNTGPKMIRLEMSTNDPSKWEGRGIQRMYNFTKVDEQLIISIPSGFGVLVSNFSSSQLIQANYDPNKVQTTDETDTSVFYSSLQSSCDYTPQTNIEEYNHQVPVKIIWSVTFKNATKSMWWILETSSGGNTVARHDTFNLMAWCTTQQYFSLEIKAKQLRNISPHSDDIIVYENQLGILKDLMCTFDIETLPLDVVTVLATIFYGTKLYVKISQRIQDLLTLGQM